MNLNNMLSRVPHRYWGFIALLFWGLTTLFLVRHDPFAIEEGAAKALLLAWSIADNVAISVVTFGVPDLRTLLFIPIGVLEPSSIFAAKLFTVLCFAVTVLLLYLWRRQSADTESALLACSLLLISPLTLQQIDTLSPGTYLLLAFALGAWLNQAYRATPHAGGGWFFAQLFICAISVSLHPAGLAYPLALLWSWYKNPLDSKQQKYFFIGVSFVVLLTLFTTYIGHGWNHFEWRQNPIRNLSIILLGSSLSDEITVMRWLAGGLILLALIIVLFKQFRTIWSDFTGRILLIGSVLGAAVSDSAWSIITLCVILFFGFPLLLRESTSGRFIHHRDIALVLVFVLFTFFTWADKEHYEIRQSGILADQDQLFQTLAQEVEMARKNEDEDPIPRADDDKNNVIHNIEDVDNPLEKSVLADKSVGGPLRLRVASQWPGRTMIACKCDTLPLPPAAPTPDAQLAMMRGITHILFDPKLVQNEALSRNLAMLSGSIETLALQPGGVVLRFKNVNKKPPSGKL
jgi:hypothetical protein